MDFLCFMELFAVHHQKFTFFLGAAVQPAKTSAREKLIKLSANQFLELSTDVYDELSRRETNNGNNRLNLGPFLPLNEEYHKKRNQARQKLATLQMSRFKELCGDVLYEIQQRFPLLLNSSNPSMNVKPSENVVANSGQTPSLSMVRSGFESEHTTVSDSTFDVKQLRQHIDTLNSLLQEKDQEIVFMYQQYQQQKHELEFKYNELNKTHEQLKNDHMKLKEDLKHQTKITSDIRVEASNLLQEIKTLSADNQRLYDEKDQFVVLVESMKADIVEMERSKANRLIQIKNLENEVEEWKSKTYQLEKKVSKREVVISRTNPNIDLQNDGIHTTPVFQLERIQFYIDSIDKFLEECRNQKEAGTNILVAMRAVVISCKNITEDCDQFEKANVLAPIDKESISGIKQQLSTSLTKQMHIAKEAATIASNEEILRRINESTIALTTVVVDLITTVNRIVDQTLANQVRNETFKENGYNLQELKIFLEQQADFIVQEIQLVLDQLRLAKPSQDFENTINRISNIVEEIVKVTTETLEVEPNMEMGFDIVDQLTAVNEKLNVSSRVLKSDTSKVVKQQVASNAYEIAKFVKQLIGLLE